MAKLVDPDSLNQGTEVVINTGAKTIRLLVAGNLNDTNPGSTSGVTLQAVYSFLKEEWKTDAALNKFKFPIKMYTKTDGTLQNGWTWYSVDSQTRNLIRDAGWTEVDGDQYSGIISLGNFDSSSDQAYYQQVAGFSATTSNFDKTGNLNESIRIKDQGVFDYTGYLKVFLRIADGAGAGKLYSSYNLISEQGLSLLEPVLYRLPLSNSTDLKINTSDATIDGATSPWQNIKAVYLKGAGFTQAAATTYAVNDVVRDGLGRWAFCTGAGTVVTPGGAYSAFGGTSTWQAFDGEQQIGTNYYAFNRVLYLTTGTATANQIYNWGQRQLRKTSNINTGTTTNNATQGGYGTVNGNVAVDLLEYVGDTLKTKPGVLIRNFNVNDQNSMVFRDITVGGGGLNSEGVPITSTERTYPFVSAGTITFSSNLVTETDANTKYTMYFTYITTTTNTGLSITGASGSTCTLNWSGTTLDHLTNGDYIKTSGFATANNNGVFLVGAVDTGLNTAALTKQDSNNPANEAVGPSVTVLENPFDTAGAIIVDNNSGVDITGQITAASINFDFDYTNNVQGGRTGGSDAPVTLVAQGLPLAEWVEVTSTITQTTGIAIAVTANDERNYANPA